MDDPLLGVGPRPSPADEPTPVGEPGASRAARVRRYCSAVVRSRANSPPSSPPPQALLHILSDWRVRGRYFRMRWRGLPRLLLPCPLELPLVRPRPRRGGALATLALMRPARHRCLGAAASAWTAGRGRSEGDFLRGDHSASDGSWRGDQGAVLRTDGTDGHCLRAGHRLRTAWRMPRRQRGLCAVRVR